MNKWVIKRLVKGGITIWAVVTITFGLIRLMPGGPVEHVRAQIIQQQGADQISEERLNRLTDLYLNIQPDEPLWRQYIDYMVATLQGDFGESMWYNEPVIDIIAEALPWTIFIMAVSIILSFAIGIVAGVFMAYYQGSEFDFIGTTVATILNSIPFYLAALILLYFLAYQFSLFPTGGRMNARTESGLNLPFIRGVLYHAALPILSMVITEWGGWALSMRGNSISVLGRDYTYVARLRGVPDRQIAMKYVGRNAILPLYTGLMIAIGFVIGGAVILEQIFSYAGLGYYIVEAINARDYPLMMGAFLIITISVVIGVLFADLTYGKLDPRIEGGTNEKY